MENGKNPYLTLIPILFLLFTILLISTLFLQKRKQERVKTSPTPTFTFPTTHPQAKTRLTPLPTISSTITPTPIPPTFTGVKEEPIPQEMVDFSKQKLSLMQKLPLKTTDFAIDFDYDNDKFVVKLNPPHEDSQKKFDDWLKNNYPSIPKDLFLFQ
jgi:type IV secretory pathway VirB10-like protein